MATDKKAGWWVAGGAFFGAVSGSFTPDSWPWWYELIVLVGIALVVYGGVKAAGFIVARASERE